MASQPALPVIVDFVGSTIRTTWINSGTTAIGISSSVFDRVHALVSSIAQTSSGNGHYYANVAMPVTPGNYLVKQMGVIDSNTYVRWQILKALEPEVD